MKGSKIALIKLKAIKNFNELNQKLEERFKLTEFGDGKHKIIEEIISQTINITIDSINSEKINRSEIIKHYKQFFNLEELSIGENDQLMIDWAEELLKLKY